MQKTQSTIDSLKELNSRLVVEIDKLRKENVEIPELRKKFAEVEAKKAELEAKNTELLKQIMEENTKREADTVELKARIKELEKNKIDTTALKTENDELKARVAKLEQKQLQNDKEKTNLIAKLDDDTRENNQSSVNTASCKVNSDDIPEQIDLQCDDTPVSDITDDASNSDVCQETNPQCTISPICTKPKSLEEQEMDDFLDRKEKEEVRDMMIKRNRGKKLQGSFNNSTPPMPSEISTMQTSSLSDNSTKELLQDNEDSKTAKKCLDQSQDKTSKSHKKKGIENIGQVIVNGIQDNIISPNHVVEILASNHSETQTLLDLARLFDKATNAEYYAIKANQEETLCWINYGKEFIIQYNDLMKHSNGKIGEKKAKSIIYDKILEHLTIIREKRSKETGFQFPEISRKTLCKKTQRAVKTYKLFEKIVQYRDAKFQFF
ncbi:hypothetical protein Glove_302g50 [Diversispora epigaea]|uniref:Uncharacterized protein n=1 Tax=Diversispora epigaea TaxID=1348612 RepID=A0A397HVD8_9GLOM|nr:hypothetical protein Glove_302g50 [Diversispora epigaea]